MAILDRYNATIILEQDQVSALANLLFRLRYPQHDCDEDFIHMIPPNYRENLLDLQKELFGA